MAGSFVFYESFFEAIKDLEAEEFKECMCALVEYALNDSEESDRSMIANVYLKMAKPQIDANKIRRENGAKGGKAKNAESKVKQDEARSSKPKQTEANLSKPKQGLANVNVNVNVNDNVNDNVKEKDAEGIPKENRALLETQAKEAVDLWNALESLGLPKVIKLDKSSTRYKTLIARLQDNGMDDFRKCIEAVRESGFLRGENQQGWTATFDWIINKSNFVKILEGNYKNTGRSAPKKGGEEKTNRFNNFTERKYDFATLEQQLLNRSMQAGGAV